jgi:hypothetical protein
MSGIGLDANSLRIALSALRAMYGDTDPLYYSVGGGSVVLESAGGAHRFIITFSVDSGVLPIQKTTVGAFTRFLSMLREYDDLAVSAVNIVSGDLIVDKSIKRDGDNGETETCSRLLKTMPKSVLSKTEIDMVVSGRGAYTGKKMFSCDASIGVAASKAGILGADTLYLRGKNIYCMSGGGICRVKDAELDDTIDTQLDSAFVYRLTKLGAETYDFYPGYVVCTVGDVAFKLGMADRSGVRVLSPKILELFDEITASARVYAREVYALYGKSSLRIDHDGGLVLGGGVRLSAPFILPLSGDAADMADMVIPESVARAAGDSFTAGALTLNGKAVAGVFGECDIVYSQSVSPEGGDGL